MTLEDFKGLIFDLDGTLVDSMPLHVAAWCKTAPEYGLSVDGEWIYQYGGVPSRKIAAMLGEAQGITLDCDAVARRKTAYYVAMIGQATPFPAMLHLVQSMSGRVPMAIGTGSLRSNAELILEQSGLGEYIKTVVAADDVTEHKPQPHTFLLAAQRIGVPPEQCLVFEDTQIGRQAAHAAGMKCVMVVEGKPDWRSLA
ncbi:MAG: HAD family hydrolase [Aeromonadaceae bacterium]